jgi:hypothetical protein
MNLKVRFLAWVLGLFVLALLPANTINTGADFMDDREV